MKILAIDTSLSACSIAILNTAADQPITAIHRSAPRQQTQLLLPMLTELLAKVSLQLKDIQAIAFGAGPGSFTGLRITSSVVQALSYAANIRVIKVSTLAALAQTIFDTHSVKNIFVALDAHMGQIYWGVYELDSHRLATPCQEDMICTPAETVKYLPNTNENWVGIGDAWLKYANILKPELRNFFPTQIISDASPNAEAILRLAMSKLDTDRINFDQVIPTYLR